MIYDVAIVGAGMAGASLAAELDESLSVLLLEQEDQPGYHATGRSAAFWDECYGGPEVQPLTSASGPFLANPPSDFSHTGFLTRRGVLYLGRELDEQDLRQFVAEFERSGVKLDRLDQMGLSCCVKGLAPFWTQGIYGPACCDIDVAALHAAYLRKARQNGVKIVTRAEVQSLEQKYGQWDLGGKSRHFRAKTVVNAAGAWADEVAKLAGVRPLGHQPLRRTVAQVKLQKAVPETLPLVIDFHGNFYFKPASNGRLWLSPQDESLSRPCDAAPEEMDIAKAISKLQEATDWQVVAVEKKWAGLRTFAPDRLPVYGFDPQETGFFWCTGQGGFGIQTAPAAAKLCAALIEGRSAPTDLAHIDATKFYPSRFAN